MKLRQSDSLGTKIRLLRLEQGKTQSEIAEILGISRTCLANYETGKREPDGMMLCRMAEALGVSADFLLETSVGRNHSVREDSEEIKRMRDFKKEEMLSLKDLDPLSRTLLLDFYHYLKEREKKRNKK